MNKSKKEWTYITAILGAIIIFLIVINVLQNIRRETPPSKETSISTFIEPKPEEKWADANRFYLAKAYDDAKTKLSGLRFDSIYSDSANALWDKIIILEGKEKTQKKIESAKETLESVGSFDGNLYLNDIQTLQSGIEILNDYVFEAKSLKSEGIPELKSLGNQINAKATALQAKWNPTFRKNAGKVFDKNLWRDDIDARAFGTGNKTLEFVGGFFVSNANIEDFHALMRTDISALGFTRVQYRWYDGGEYTYYTLK